MENQHLKQQESQQPTQETLSDTASEAMPQAAEEQKPKSRKKWIILGIIAAILLIITAIRLFDALRPAEVAEIPPVNVKVATAEVQSIYATSPLTGRIQAADEVALVPLAAGEVTAVYVSMGDHVQKGTVLFEIDKTQVSNSVNQAQAGVQQAQVGVQQAQIGYEQAKLGLDNATTTYNSSKSLYDSGAISLQQFQQAELQYNNAVQGLAAAREAVNAAQAGVKTAQSAASSAQDVLANYTVTAPISGYVTSVNVTVGSIAAQSSPAVTLSDTDNLEIKTTVSEYLVTKLAQGDSVDIYISILSDKPFKGTVKALSPAPAMGTLTYPVTISVDDASDSIKAGMFAEIQIVSNKRDAALCVPSSAVFMKGGKSTVVILDKKNIPTLKTVTTGLDNGTLVEIASGLSEGETIVISGQEYVTEGIAVKVMK